MQQCENQGAESDGECTKKIALGTTLLTKSPHERAPTHIHRIGFNKPVPEHQKQQFVNRKKVVLTIQPWVWVEFTGQKRMAWRSTVKKKIVYTAQPRAGVKKSQESRLPLANQLPRANKSPIMVSIVSGEYFMYLSESRRRLSNRGPK
jgi:hypothetical protein